MNTEKLKVPVDILKVGMYVSELDRPWIETPFIFQGFLITNDEELDQLHQCCDYVFIDIEKSQVEIPLEVLKELANATQTEEETIYPNREHLPYLNSFEEEFPKARLIYERVQTQIRNLYRDIRIGRAVRTAEVEKYVEQITESILRNPDAMMLMTNMKAVDDYLVVHSINVCILSLIFARFIGVSKDEMEELGIGALLHDVGEIRLPKELLNKPADLTAEEHATVQKHTAYGVAVLKQSPGMPESTFDIVLHHHERVDRSGYPDKLSGQEISLFSKLVGIVDVYDSLTSTTPYRSYMSSTDALKSMYDWRGTLFDENLIEGFIRCLGVYPIGSTLELNNGEIGIVISASPENRLFPKLLLVRDDKEKFYDPPKIINLSQFRSEDSYRYEIKNIVQPEKYGIDLKRYILRELIV
jgi:HD-GYP domain-containing protein (c-di-GMP phosphodiesterase class II)